MNSTINDVKIPTAGTLPDRSRSSAPSQGDSVSNTADRPSPAAAETAAPTATESTVIQTKEAAHDALQRLKEQLASQPTEALAAFQRITGQGVDHYLGSAVSEAS